MSQVIPPNKFDSSPANGAVIPQKLAGGQVNFPTLILAATVVSAGIFVVAQMDERAAWLLAFLILLTVAFAYKSFGSELTSLVTGPQGNQQSVSQSASGGTTASASGG